jgi:NAD-dependent deacetylase
MSRQFSAQLLSVLGKARSVVAFTGAGISAESGVPTFRGEGGIWQKMRSEELASMEGFLANPALVWEWYQHRRAIIDRVRPNRGHEAIVAMERIFPDVAVITQNIDNLHRRAGSRRVIELHGNIERNYCTKCGHAYPTVEVPAPGSRPACRACGGLVRPDVVWFGEPLPEEEWESGVRASVSADCFLSIGTSSVVYPAASLPLAAKRSGAFLVEVNPEPTPLTEIADEFLQGAAGEVLPALVEAARGLRP